MTERMSPVLDRQNVSRQEQILLLAADGLTDKEIAARLSLSPETVGTYWRRILSKYAACSRTEVVAKVLRTQSQAAMVEAQGVRDCLEETVEHLIQVLAEKDRTAGWDTETRTLKAMLELVPIAIVRLDREGMVHVANASARRLGLRKGFPVTTALSNDDADSLRSTIDLAETIGETCECLVNFAADKFRVSVSGLRNELGFGQVISFVKVSA